MGRMNNTPESDPVGNAIENIRRNEYDPRFQEIQGSYLFDVTGYRRFRVDVDHGRLKLREDATTADCIIHTDRDEFGRIARGEQNLITAYMQGRVQIEGDPALAQQLHGILPPPPQKAGEGRQP
jgi:hypothetical protein